MSQKKLNMQNTPPEYETQLADLQQEISALRKKNEDLESRLQAYSHTNTGQISLINKLVDNVPFAVIFVDAEQVIYHLNQMAITYLYTEEKDVRGSRITSYISTQDYEKILSDARSGNNELYEIQLKVNNRDIAVSAFINSAGSKEVTVLSILDITNIKHAEKELKKLAQVKDNFVAILSHELRTPLNSIIGFTSLLKGEIFSDVSDEAKSYLDTLENAGENMLNVVNHLLEFSDLTAEKVKPDYLPLDIDMITSQLLYRTEEKINQHQNRLEVACEDIPPFKQDLALLLKILYELVSNANKFTHDGVISLDISIENASQQEWLIFKVSDTGCGMTPETLENIFIAFSQADTSFTRNHEGLGLGLSIVEKIVLLLKGKISVKSQLQVGTEFIVRVPYIPT